jgi:hypothetical protein
MGEVGQEIKVAIHTAAAVAFKDLMPSSIVPNVHGRWLEKVENNAKLIGAHFKASDANSRPPNPKALYPWKAMQLPANG